MRLLVTRPEPDARRTVERLRAAGHAVLAQPLLTIVFAPPPADVPVPAALLVTSQNGLRALARWPQARAWRGKPLFVVGAATARAAAALGFTNVRSGGADAGALAEAVIAGVAKGSGPLVYPAARDRAGALAGRLGALGYDVRAIEAYRADVAPRFDATIAAAFAAGGLDGVLLYSRRTAQVFRDLATAAGLGARLGSLAYFAISPEVADALAGIPGRMHVAAHADEDSLFALIPGVA